MLSFHTPDDIQKQLAADVRNARVHAKDWKRETLAGKSGVPVSTIKRFETTGEISLKQLRMLAHALGLLGHFEALLRQDAEDMSMSAYIQQQSRKTRSRGSK